MPPKPHGFRATNGNVYARLRRHFGDRLSFRGDGPGQPGPDEGVARALGAAGLAPVATVAFDLAADRAMQAAFAVSRVRDEELRDVRLVTYFAAPAVPGIFWAAEAGVHAAQGHAFGNGASCTFTSAEFALQHCARATGDGDARALYCLLTCSVVRGHSVRVNDSEAVGLLTSDDQEIHTVMYGVPDGSAVAVVARSPAAVRIVGAVLARGPLSPSPFLAVPSAALPSPAAAAPFDAPAFLARHERCALAPDVERDVAAEAERCGLALLGAVRFDARRHVCAGELEQEAFARQHRLHGVYQRKVDTMYHATRAADAESVVRMGLTPVSAHANGCAFGRGVYTTGDLAVALKYCGQRHGDCADTVYCVFVCAVLRGRAREHAGERVGMFDGNGSVVHSVFVGGSHASLARPRVAVSRYAAAVRVTHAVLLQGRLLPVVGAPGVTAVTPYHEAAREVDRELTLRFEAALRQIDRAHEAETRRREQRAAARQREADDAARPLAELLLMDLFAMND
jgi:hypothetical protein